ncbi:MAG TPA: MCE family protein, partial [Rhodospirillales bacterium]|nr:MCE family protein [Rhodospirillales bacterium]
MSRSTDPKLVGAFVLGALLLFLALVLAVGGGRLFARTERYLVRFDESVKGLRRGATVAFRGVPVGTVVEITAEYDVTTGGLRVPVVLEIEPGRIRLEGDGGKRLEELVAAGLRARLQLESLLTGQLYVALDIYPEAPPPPPAPPTALPEIPALPSPLSRLTRSLDEVAATLPVTVERVDRVAARVERLLGDANLARMEALLANGAGAAGRMERLLADLPPLVADLRAAAAAANALARDLGSRLERRDAQLEKTLATVADTSREIGKTARQLRLMVEENRASVKDFTDTGLPLLTGLIEDATRMVNELRSLLRDIRQDPARFFFGDRLSEGVR